LDADKRLVKIFISSPSDVRPERLTAERVIERLGREFVSHLDVRAILWEREPLLSSEHFQEHIPPPHESDVVVVILWSRLGVLLPAGQYTGPISKSPVTGTEWEFEDALASHRERQLPDLLFYRKQAEITAGLSDRKLLEDRLAQFDGVESFVRRWFLAADGASFTAAIHAFADTAEFEERLETHLRALLRKRIGDSAGAENREVRWHQAPFRGLMSFEYEHAPVFFGRSKARSNLRNLLAERIGAGNAFILVMGASGSGKSSLIKAGLLPDLSLPGMIGQVGLCRTAILRPSDAEGDPLRALALALLGATALPELRDLRYDADSLLRLLRAAPDDADLVIRQGLAEAAARGRLTERAQARLAIVVDQLEELFTLGALAPAERQTFVRALKALARCGSVWILAAMRSDFFDRLETLPILAECTSDGGRYLLLPPSDSEIGQIIRQPAREAGLAFEVNEEGIGLDAVIQEAATKNRTALPLLSFLLDQLWQRRTDDGQLTFAAYQALGGLEGALGQRAEENFQKLAPDVQAALPGVLRALVTVAEGTGRNATARPAPLSAFPAGSARRVLVDALISPEARLLLAEREGGEARVRISHEALLTHWPRAREQIAEDMQDLRLRARLEGAADLWSAANRSDRHSLLLRRGKPLSEAEDLLRRRREDLSPILTNFIEASGAAYRNTIRWRIGLSLTAAAVIAAIAVFGSYQLRDWLDYRKQRQLEASRTDISGTLIAYSTKRGAIAVDSLDGQDSPFLEALVKAIDDPTLDVNTLFARITEQVALSTKYAQLPELSTTLNGRVYLRDPPKNRKTFVLSVGAANYLHVPKLATPVNDAKAFAHAFDALGYRVQLLLDPDRDQLTGAISKFSNMIADASDATENQTAVAVPEHRGFEPVPARPTRAPDTLAIVYLAGQGVLVDGVDYFAPVDTDTTRFDGLDRRALNSRLKEVLVPIDGIVKRLEESAAIQIIIIDACRDDPFSR
jgi:Caspase domain